LAGIARRWCAGEKSALLEGLEHAAQVAGVEPQIAAEIGGGKPCAMRDFVQHARLGQRELALVQPFFKQADLAGVKTVEMPDGLDRARRGRGGFGHGRDVLNAFGK
jgi:hypothetical protein